MATHYAYFRLTGGDNNNSILMPAPGRPIEINGVSIVSNGGISANGSNNHSFQVLGADGSSVLANRSTSSTAMVDGTVEDLTLQNLDQSLIPAAGKAIIQNVHSGTGPTFDVTVCVTFSDARTV